MSIDFVETTGARLQVFKAGDGNRLALCLHGFPEHAISWRQQVAKLTELGYTVWIPNQRGYGLSSMPAETTAYGLQFLLQDIADLIDAAGMEDVTLVGHDWGALLCWFFTIRNIRPVNRMVLFSICHPAAITENANWRQQLRSVGYVPLVLLPGAPELSVSSLALPPVRSALMSLAKQARLDSRVLGIYLDNIRRPGAITAMANYYRANAAQATWNDPQLQVPVNIPVLQINGDRDPWIDAGSLAASAEFAPQLDGYLLQDTSHWPHLERPDKVNELVTEWLESASETRVA